MAEPTERRSNRSRKPKVHFDNQIAQSGPSGLSIASNAPAKPTKPAPKSTKKPTPTAKSKAVQMTNNRGTIASLQKAGLIAEIRKRTYSNCRGFDTRTSCYRVNSTCDGGTSSGGTGGSTGGISCSRRVP
jgi:hypothetical protein